MLRGENLERCLGKPHGSHIPHRRLSEKAAIFAIELVCRLVADFEGGKFQYDLIDPPPPPPPRLKPESSILLIISTRSVRRRCRVDPGRAGTTVTESGQDYTLTVNVTFKIGLYEWQVRLRWRAECEQRHNQR